MFTLKFYRNRPVFKPLAKPRPLGNFMIGRLKVNAPCNCR